MHLAVCSARAKSSDRKSLKSVLEEFFYERFMHLLEHLAAHSLSDFLFIRRALEFIHVFLAEICRGEQDLSVAASKYTLEFSP